MTVKVSNFDALRLAGFAVRIIGEEDIAIFIMSSLRLFFEICLASGSKFFQDERAIASC